MFLVMEMEVENFELLVGGCCEAGLVVFEWEREFLVML